MGDIKKRRILWAAHSVLILLVFALGTASTGTIAAANNDIESTIIFIDEQLTEFSNRINASNNLYYIFASLVIFTVFDVVGMAFYLRWQFRGARDKDKVCTF